MSKKKEKKKKKKKVLLSQLQHIINIDTRSLFYNGHIKPHIGHASVEWDGCSEVHLKDFLKRKKI